MGLFISVVVNNLVINTVAIHISTFGSGDYVPRDGFANSHMEMLCLSF